MSESLLRKGLKRSDQARLSRIHDYVCNLWALGDVLHPYFTLHGPQHLEQVEKCAAEVLAVDHRSIRDTLDANQLFQLLAAVWLHDAGMIVPATDEERTEAQAARMEVEKWVRDTHHIRSERFVRHHAEALGLTAHDAAVIGSICRGHRRENLMDQKYFSSSGPNTCLLSSILRIADELDISNARVPDIAMRIHWNEMDAASQWHWVKHWCVAEPRHVHDEQKDGNGVVTLSYSYSLVLPDPIFEEPFIDRVLLPIRRTLEEEYVSTILYRYRLAVAPDRFEFITFVNDPIDELQPSIRTRLTEVFGTATSPTPTLVQARQALMSTVPEPAREILERRFYRVTHTFASSGISSDVLDSTVSGWWSLMNSATSATEREAVLHTMQSFVNSREWEQLPGVSAVPYSQRQAQYIVSLLSEMSDTIWRLFALSKGDSSEQLLQLAHLREKLDPSELGAIAIHYTDRHFPLSVRQAASTILVEIALETHDCDCKTAIALSREQDDVIRNNAIRMLQYAAGPGALTRLAEMSECEIVGAIRENAWQALIDRITDFNGPVAFSKTDLRILIIGDGDGARYFLDDFYKRKAIVHIAGSEQVALEEIGVWRPDVLFCFLGTSSVVGFASLPKEQVYRLLIEAKKVREDIRAVVLLDALGNIDPAILETGVLYLRMPVTASRAANAIERPATFREHISH